MPKLYYKRRDELEAELLELKAKDCESCTHYTTITTFGMEMPTKCSHHHCCKHSPVIFDKWESNNSISIQKGDQ